MSGFTPFKKHANKFNYLPRYYDPEKEERDRRRAELRGERAEDAGKEYKPGQYIRTQSIRATLNALDNLRSPAEIAAKRGKSVEELLG